MNKRVKDLTFLKNRKIAHRGIYDNKRIYENTRIIKKQIFRNNL